ncbi:hypothetical protein CMV_001909 [Castanea mollissima]|uniref:Uncharacterized protein n=1 Tax=Castanea mollissima TaxID=60419 RepID=A0A8J4S3A8_9ROSI|nr:hypothetical protein CMV_001909 [Castanea mollissima]
MGEEVESVGHRVSVAAPLIFTIVITFQLLSGWLERLKKKGGSTNATVIQLHVEIKQLLKEASSLSRPSTFAQAAKLRRLAAAKEKELANYLESHSREMKMSYDLYLKVLFLFKVLTYFVLICWFWRVPVATISQRLVQPFGNLLSWRTGGTLNNHVMVGIIPWLILSTRVLIRVGECPRPTGVFFGIINLILLENQLPLFILNELYSQSGNNECFMKLACNYFFPTHKEVSTEMDGVKHFADLHRTFYRPPPLDHPLDLKTDSPIEHLYSATKLVDTAGLIFQKHKKNQSEENQFREKRLLLHIKLKKPSEICPTSCLMHCFKNFSCFKRLRTRMVVPQFVVDDGTEELFRNLMALEQCHYPSEAYICNYIVLLDYLINSKEDVELLVEKRVIVNSLGSNQAVAEMVNKLCLEIVEMYSCYRHIADDLNKHYDSRWNKNMASLNT